MQVAASAESVACMLYVGQGFVAALASLQPNWKPGKAARDVTVVNKVTPNK